MENYRMARAVRLLRDEVDTCTLRNPTVSNAQLKSVEQIIDEVIKKADSEGARASVAK